MAKQSVELRTIGRIQALLEALEDDSARERVIRYLLESSSIIRDYSVDFSEGEDE